jgi:dihydroorotate dehydrogenase (NAD+) catalytic subunit
VPGVAHPADLDPLGFGIAPINDVLEFIMAGSTGIAIGTANFNNPFVMPEIISELSKYMEENNIT